MTWSNVDDSEQWGRCQRCDDIGNEESVEVGGENIMGDGGRFKEVTIVMVGLEMTAVVKLDEQFEATVARE